MGCLLRTVGVSVRLARFGSHHNATFQEKEKWRERPPRERSPQQREAQERYVLKREKPPTEREAQARYVLKRERPQERDTAALTQRS